ncbi:cytochrome ubiquinol oxidase subunit I [Vagococcus coleopterorum]|uniref:Cytochrome ubiquinol oxidase subunit I n=1 Tax=Vagococcus coleopterorum TaxID=2714946 RepID=A0A6G8ALY7_9ENTE|nr:cytochrome ubiquinol oxidase subunit I [Vagococcus coleopterorum]QIL46016.1 cytochrome ubiquinol oxidase subunit I [Vagococcus coleopterorum]
MGILELARFQFGMTTIFHFFFVPVSIGLGLAIAIMETMYAVKKEQVYRDMSKFWGKIFLLSFAVGVVTGIIQEFQFGMNWSDYSRFMGDIFGAPLAVEALLAFFMESTFIGIWAFTWDKVSPKVHAIFMWFVAIGSTLSALWILAANSFMQNPVADIFTYNAETNRAELVSFGALLKNPQLWMEFPHVIFGAMVTGGFIIAGISAWKLLRKEDTIFFKTSMKLGLILGLVFSVATIAVGHAQTQAIIEDQPMKFAATEGIYEDTPDFAPWKTVGLFDEKNHKEGPSIEIPGMLSILGSSHEGSFKGMNTINKELQEKYEVEMTERFGPEEGKKYGEMDYYVPTTALFWSFRVMAGFGSLMALLSIVGLYLLRKGTIEKMKWLLVIIALCTFAPFISNTSGWLITELGRFPWTVYGLFTIGDSVSPNVTANQLLFSNIMYFFIFALLGGVMVFLTYRTAKYGPYAEEKEIENVDPLSKEAF